MRLTKTLRQSFVRAAMNDVPEIKYDDEIRKVAKQEAEAMMPPEVAKVYKKNPEWFESVARYVSGFGYVYLPCPSNMKMSDSFYEKVKALVESRNTQQNSRNALETKLAAAAESVTTRKALAELLPEFAKYLPADEATTCRSLPAVANLVADFAKAGWPKEQTKVKA